MFPEELHCHRMTCISSLHHLEREGGREGEREGGREGGKERGRERMECCVCIKLVTHVIYKWWKL